LEKYNIVAFLKNYGINKKTLKPCTMGNIEKDRIVTRRKTNGFNWIAGIVAIAVLLFFLYQLNIWPFNEKSGDVGEKKKDKKEVVATVDDDNASSIKSLEQYAKDLNDSIEILNQRLSQSGPDITPHVSKWSYRQPTKRGSAPSVSYRRKARWSGITYQLPPPVIIPAPPVDTSTHLLGTEIVTKNGQTYLRKIYGKNKIVSAPASATGSY
jgi:hypothetical protein